MMQTDEPVWSMVAAATKTKIKCKLMAGMGDYSYSISIYHTGHCELSDYRWIKGLDHLRRINKYRRRVGCWQLNFDDDDMFELSVLGKE